MNLSTIASKGKDMEMFVDIFTGALQSTVGLGGVVAKELRY